MTNFGNTPLRGSDRSESRKTDWLRKHSQRSNLSVLAESRIAWIGMLVVIGGSSFAFLYSLFAFSGWRKAFVVLGLGCALTILFFILAKYIVYSYRKDRQREISAYRHDHIIR